MAERYCEQAKLMMIAVSVLVLLTAGGAGHGGPWEETANPEYAFIITTDYWSAAYYSTIEILPPRATRISIQPVSIDAVAYYDQAEDMVFVVNRFLADNIQIVDPNAGFLTVGQYSVGNGSNPHDIRLATCEKAYVSRFEWKTLLIVEPYTGDSLGVIDLSPVADSDGIPEMDRMAMVGDRLFVTLNSIDHTTWLPNGPGKVAVIDTREDTLIDCDPASPGIQPIMLEVANPCSELRYDPHSGDLIVGCLGAWGVPDGGVVAIDPSALTTRPVIITEMQIGGDICDAVLTPEGKGYAVVLDTVPWPDNYARLVAFDPLTAEVKDTLHQQTSGMGSSLGTIEVNRQTELYLCDRDATQPGVRIYDSAADTLITHIDVGVPPYDVAFVQAAGDGPGPTDHCTLDQNHPNPFKTCTDITYAIHTGAGPYRIRLDIYDVRGRLVRTVVDDRLGPGTYSEPWSGKDDEGNPVATGVYFYRLRWKGQSRTKRMILLR